MANRKWCPPPSLSSLLSFSLPPCVLQCSEKFPGPFWKSTDRTDRRGRKIEQQRELRFTQYLVFHFSFLVRRNWVQCKSLGIALVHSTGTVAFPVHQFSETIFKKRSIYLKRKKAFPMSFIKEKGQLCRVQTKINNNENLSNDVKSSLLLHRRPHALPIWREAALDRHQALRAQQGRVRHEPGTEQGKVSQGENKLSWGVQDSRQQN